MNATGYTKPNGKPAPATYASACGCDINTRREWKRDNRLKDGSCTCAPNDPNKPPRPHEGNRAHCGRCGGHRLASAVAAWKTAKESALGLGMRVRVPLGLRPLDAATRGGMPLAKLMVMGGAPGALKTGLQAHLAYGLAERGIHTGFACYDEDADSVLVRIGQNHGLDRTALEDREHADHESTKRQLAAWCERAPLLHIDALAERASIEEIASELRRRAGAAPAVLFVDSLQTLARRFEAGGGVGQTDRRLTIDSVLDELRGLARRFDLAVIVTSELSRGAYPSESGHAAGKLAQALQKTSDPNGNRTHVTGVRGRCPNR